LGGKLISDTYTLSGVPGALAQIGDIAKQQVRSRWGSAGYVGPQSWFRPLVPSDKETGIFKSPE
jgi:hypothetical protein